MVYTRFCVLKMAQEPLLPGSCAIIASSGEFHYISTI